jgi:hypothetical protein
MSSLPKTVVQVVLDGLGTHEQWRADLRVDEAFAGQSGDLSLLGGEVLGRLDGALSGPLASRQELALRPLGEGLHTPSR